MRYMSVIYFLFPWIGTSSYAHRPCRTPWLYCTCVSAGRQTIHMYLAAGIDAFGWPAMSVSWFSVLFLDMDALVPRPNILRYFWWISKVGTCSETLQVEGKNTFFPATSLVLLVCDQKRGLTWFSAVLSTHTSQWSWWEVQELSGFEIKPRIWLIMLWRRYLTTKWKYIQIEGSKALNTLLWTNLSGGVSQSYNCCIALTTVSLKQYFLVF